MGIRELIANEQYKEALDDLEYSFLVKVYLRILLCNNSDERPDFIQAKKLYNQLFLNSPEATEELNETLELSIDLDNWEVELICGIIDKFFETKNKNALIATRLHTLVCDTPVAEASGNKSSKSFKSLPCSNIKRLPDENHYHPLQPLKLDEKFSNCNRVNRDSDPHKTNLEVDENFWFPKVKAQPASKMMKEQISHSNKVIRCYAHNRPATEACMLRHYGEYFCDMCSHKWGEVEQLVQDFHPTSSKAALREVQDNTQRRASRPREVIPRTSSDAEVDNLYFSIFDNIKELQTEIKYARNGKGSDLVSDWQK